MRIRMEARDAYLWVEAAGPFDAEVGRRAVGEIFEACASQGLHLVLVDARGLEHVVGISERFELGRSFAERRTGPVRIAILVDASQMVTKTLEDSARNRGVPVLTTAVAQEAYGFLGVTPPG